MKKKDTLIEKKIFDLTLDRLEFCFSNIKLKYYLNNSIHYFNHLNSDHMVIYLYLLGNTIWSENGNLKIADKCFYLNKIMHSVDLYYEVSMPDIFVVVHPVGTVIGRGKYSDNLVIYQNCTIGSNNEKYPEIGKNVILFAKSSVIGNCKIGNDVVIGTNSFIIDKTIKKSSKVFGNYPETKIQPLKNNIISNYFYDS